MDVERTIEFLLKSAAEHNQRMAQVEASIATVTELVGRLAQADLILAERMRATDERLKALANRMDQLAEAQAATDGRLNALIDVLDRIVRRNGHARE